MYAATPLADPTRLRLERIASLPPYRSRWSWVLPDAPPEVRGGVKIFPKRPEPVVVRQDDVLLAVIHGYQKEGRRNPLSTQTFLLRNVGGGELRTRSAESVMASTADGGGFPQPRGDVISEKPAGEDGFIYWTGARYASAVPPADISGRRDDTLGDPCGARGCSSHGPKRRRYSSDEMNALTSSARRKSPNCSSFASQ
jgi:hypothetical protein